ncbi:MAG: hypothetical protein CR975_00245 [Gammaproteobacteria bacterium]|nr:MAG: hypothetical protein CR975_00245 [Gammaproteobacteria bacterium]
MYVDWQSIVTAVLVIAILGYLMHHAKYSKNKGNLSYDLTMKVIAVLVFLFAMIPLYAFLTKSYQMNKSGEMTALICLMVFSSVAAIYAIGDTFFVYGNFNNKDIAFYSPWRGLRKQKLIDLETYSYNSIAAWYVLSFKDGTKIRISTYLGGYGHLIKLIKKIK